MKNVCVNQEEGYGFSVANCRNVVFEGCTDSSGNTVPDVFNYNSHNITIAK